MENKYKEYQKLNLPQIGVDMLALWERENTFEQSIAEKEGKPAFSFYEGPPSANGMPGIHHVMARTIKDLFCRFKTMQGFQVKRKAGWDTHGLPVELDVEKSLGITKEDIGTKLSVEEYNQACREGVLKYKDVWDDLTRKMGYWVDLDHPYITFENSYIESVWNLLQKFYNKDLLYKGYTVQPYSPAAGTGLSTHELNQPGCYREVKDTSIIAQFKVVKNEKSAFLFSSEDEDVRFLAWTTTPWTLPSNCALAVGEKITYVKARTFNRYTFQPVTIILAQDLVNKYFSEEARSADLASYKEGDKLIPCKVEATFTGKDLEGVKYEQLMPYVQPDESEGEAFRVILGDFVTTEDGTGIVHTASLFGADDFRVCQANNVPSILVKDENGQPMPLVDKQGRFVKEVTDFPGYYVKAEYEAPGVTDQPDYKPTDVLIAIKLKEDNKAFLVEKYAHSYPHCWRTDKPVLYYPLDSWFVRTTAMKDKLIEHNKTINWKPASTGTGRFGNWLENLVDWNLSRSRFWGIPIPIWTSEDKSEQKCIGSVEELKTEIGKAVKAGVMTSNPLESFKPGDFSEENYNRFDLHKPYADDVVLVSDSGKPMHRESDLIDVWFDSGAMPYAQFHYPFENEELFEKNYPADFIAEGVDQTRGWFFTLHAIAVMLFDSVAFKNVVSNGLVLDKNGNKMSKRLGNAVDPFKTIEQYGPDATRWYLITNAQPWDNLRFDIEGVAEVQRKFFGTLHNTYAFFALYANIDEFTGKEAPVPVKDRPEIDRWILSELHTLIGKTAACYDDYEPTRAGRLLEEFLDMHLSNWYVRLSRRRFWKGDYSTDKISAYQTLYECLVALAKMMAPIAPFYAEHLYRDLNGITGLEKHTSVHLAEFPKADQSVIDTDLEERMELAQKISHMVLSLRKKEKIRVRQPLNRITIPVLDKKFKDQVQSIADLVLSEVNVKKMEFLEEGSGVIVKRVKPDFKKLGPRFGKDMKRVSEAIAKLNQEEIATLEREGSYEMNLDGFKAVVELADVEVFSEDIPGWLVAHLDRITVALDINITDELKEEGIAREVVNKVQNLRKDLNFEVTDQIALRILKHEGISKAINNNKDYICAETLAASLEMVGELSGDGSVDVDVDEGVTTRIQILKYQKN
ncbi:MAG: isoleucine--tRNA ligase [Flavobacteriales bacterium]|nr:isoleucine--tRNA ligase [Flavobacteriales bacterium]